MIKKIKSNIINSIINMRGSLDISGFLEMLELTIYPDVLIYVRNINPELYEENKKFTNEIIEKTYGSTELIYNKSKKRRETFLKIRNKNSKFCKDIKDFLNENEKIEYKLGMDKFLEYIKKEFKTKSKYNIRKNYQEQYKEKLYDLSKMTDSPFWMKIGNMQDRYVMHELNSLSSNDFSEEENNNINELKNDINKNIEKYEIFLQELKKHTKNNEER